MQNRMELFSIAASKIVCMTFKAKSAKSTVTPLLTRGYSSQMKKTFRENCDKNSVQQTSCEPPFPDVQGQLTSVVQNVCVCLCYGLRVCGQKCIIIICDRLRKSCTTVE